MAIDTSNKDTRTMVIQATSTGLSAEQPLEINSTKLLQKFLSGSPLASDKAQEVLNFIVDGNLPTEHAQELIAAGANVNHRYTGMENLLHLAWKHVKEDSNNGKAMFNLLLPIAILDEKAKEFYADVDPKFLQYYDSVAQYNETAQPGPASKPKY